MYPSDEKIETIIQNLRKLRKDICHYNAKSDKSLYADYHNAGKYNADMMWSKMEVENQLRRTTYNIKESGVLVSLAPETFYVTGMHEYKLWEPIS